MIGSMLHVFLLAGLLLGVVQQRVLFPSQVASPRMTVQFMASRAGFTAPGSGSFPNLRSASPGHAFLCIAIPVSTGIKEDCYGFFLAQSLGAGKGIVAGSGVVLSGALASIGVPAVNRMSQIAVSVRKPITEAQRRAILALIGRWNGHAYRLTDASCIDFVVEAAQAAGMVTPTHQPSQTPVSYLNALKAANPNAEPSPSPRPVSYSVDIAPLPTESPQNVTLIAEAGASVLVPSFTLLRDPTTSSVHLPYPDGGVALGEGWATSRGRRTSAICIDFKADTIGAQILDHASDEIIDNATLTQRLGASFSLSAGVPTLGTSTFSIDRQSSFRRDSKRRQLLGLARVVNPRLTVGPAIGDGRIALRTEYEGMARDRPDEFVRRCGEHFVSQIFNAASVVMVATIESLESETIDSLSQALDASFAVATVKARWSKFTDSLSHASRASFSVHREGGLGRDDASHDPKDFYALVSGLPALAAQAGEPYQVRLNSYTDLPNWPSGIVASTANLTALALWKAAQRFDGVRAIAQAVKDEPSAFLVGYGMTASTAGALADTLGRLIDSLGSRLATCAAAVGGAASGCSMPRLAPANDYAIRLRLPVGRGSFAEDAAVRRLVADSARDVPQYARMLEYVPYCGTERNGAYVLCRTGARETFAILRRRVPVLLDSLRTLRATWSGAHRRARIAQYLDGPNRIRCSLARTDSWCLSNEVRDSIAAVVPLLSFRP